MALASDRSMIILTMMMMARNILNKGLRRWRWRRWQSQWKPWSEYGDDLDGDDDGNDKRKDQEDDDDDDDEAQGYDVEKK